MRVAIAPLRRSTSATALAVVLLLAPIARAENQELVCARLLALAEQNPRLELERVEHEQSETIFVQGYYTVPENRTTGVGRQLRIGLVVLHARADEPAPDPVFVLHGGPGAPATKLFGRQVNGWIRQMRGVVLIDQRGTGSSNKLRVPLAGNDDDLQSYFTSYFEPERYAAAPFATPRLAPGRACAAGQRSAEPAKTSAISRATVRSMSACYRSAVRLGGRSLP